MSEQAKGSAKKIYQEPSLVIYGDIRGLTQSVGMKAHIRDAKAPRKTA